AARTADRPHARRGARPSRPRSRSRAGRRRAHGGARRRRALGRARLHAALQRRRLALCRSSPIRDRSPPASRPPRARERPPARSAPDRLGRGARRGARRHRRGRCPRVLQSRELRAPGYGALRRGRAGADAHELRARPRRRRRRGLARRRAAAFVKPATDAAVNPEREPLEDRPDAARAAEPGAPEASGADVVETGETGPVAALAERRARGRRAEAEMQNARRGAAREREELRRELEDQWLLELTAVVDDLDRGLEAARAHGAAETWIAGFELSGRRLREILERHG